MSDVYFLGKLPEGWKLGNQWWELRREYARGIWAQIEVDWSTNPSGNFRVCLIVAGHWRRPDPVPQSIIEAVAWCDEQAALALERRAKRRIKYQREKSERR